MLSISNPITAGAPQNYYLNLAQQNYYTAQFEPPGQWFGNGAAAMKLVGEVRAGALTNLFQGFSPDGKDRLVQNAGRPNRTMGWDLTFSAPKSVSVLWALAPETVRQQVEQVHQHAVQSTLRGLERSAGVARRGPAGAVQETADLVIATFQHSSSRAQDPQLHTHAVVINLTLRRDGTTGSLHSHRLFEQKMAGGNVYQAYLAAGLRDRLGLQIEPEQVGFHVGGVPRELCYRFSQRRQEIEALLTRRGETGAVAAKQATLKTRRPKEALVRSELFARWQAVGESFGWTQHEAQQLVATQPNEHRLGEHEGRRGAHLAPASPGERPAREARERNTRRDNRLHRGARAGLREPMPVQPLDRFAMGAGEFRRILKGSPKSWQQPAILQRLKRRITQEYGTPVSVLNQTVREFRAREAGRLLQIHWRPLPNPTPWLPARRKPLRITHQEPFPLASVAGLRRLKLPVLAAELPRVGLGKPGGYRPRWWKIHWKRSLGPVELRLQQRFLAPKAPRWSPLHQRSLPAFRLTARKSELTPNRQSKDQWWSH